MVNLEIFVRINKFNIECKINLLQHGLVRDLLDVLGSFYEALLKDFMLFERHRRHLRLHEDIIRRNNLSKIKLHSDHVVNFELVEIIVLFDSDEKGEGSVDNVNHFER